MVILCVVIATFSALVYIHLYSTKSSDAGRHTELSQLTLSPR